MIAAAALANLFAIMFPWSLAEPIAQTLFSNLGVTAGGKEIEFMLNEYLPEMRKATSEIKIPFYY